MEHVSRETSKKSPTFSVSLKPFVKWAGGKGQLVPRLREIYPGGLGITITKYAEPFVGGGALLFDILSSYQLEAVFISDINAELINTYQAIRDNAEDLIELLGSYEEEYIPLENDDRKTYFYLKRERFNALMSSPLGLESAALFIFLNRTCFNGLYRVNSKGFFNVPMGSYKNPTICDTNNLRNLANALSNVEIVCGDYRQSYNFIDDKTFAYFDPPYRPLNATSTFTSYTENGFDDEAQKELAEYLGELNIKGAQIALSNSDPKNTDPEDNFFDDLYSNFNINRVEASRMINSKAEGRGKISELLITNF
ncbi:MAG: DNA adenine methylase [Sphaerochaetaceae bacterium]|jgi:DNA adenine methylase